MRIRTPNLDRLMNRGVSFTNAFCTTALCSPSRSAILTGLNPFATGVHNNRDIWFRRFGTELTLPVMLKSAGWRTFTYGKTFHGYPDDPILAQMFDGWYSARCELGEETTVDIFDRKNINHAIRQLNLLATDPATSPFLMMIGVYNPHMPYNSKEKFYSHYPIEDIVIPEWSGDTPPDWVLPHLHRQAYWKLVQAGTLDEFIQGYLADVSEMDFHLGKIVSAIDATGLDPVIMLLSDNGFHFGDHETIKKFTLWDQALRVPLIVADPLGLSSHRCEDVVSFLDICPTILQMAGLPIPQRMDGTSLLPLIRSQNARRQAGALSSMYGSVSLRTNNWRVTRYESGEQELFDIANDPDNADNLANEPGYAKVLERLNVRLDDAYAAWLAPHQIAFAPHPMASTEPAGVCPI